MACKHTIVWVIVYLFTLVTVVAGQGSCYQFDGLPGAISFKDNIEFSTRAHFRLKFKTAAHSGVMYYAEGTYQRERVYDFEGVFLRDGYVHYFLFNPADFSIGSSFGFHGKSLQRLDDNQWHTLEFYRNIEVEHIAEDGTKTMEHQTGLTIDGVQQKVDKRWRDGVKIFQPIVLGEDPHLSDRQSKTIGAYKGMIKDFEEVSQGHFFDKWYSKTGNVNHCLSIPDAV